MPIVSWTSSGGGGAAQAARADVTGPGQLKRVPVSGGLRYGPEEGFWDGGIGQGGRPFVFGRPSLRPARPTTDRRPGRRPPRGQDQPLADQVPPGAHLGGDRRHPRRPRHPAPPPGQRRAGPAPLEGPVRLPRCDHRRDRRLDVGARRAARQRRGAGDLRACGRPARPRHPHHVAVHERVLDVDAHPELHHVGVGGRRARGQRRQRGHRARFRRRVGHRQRHVAVPRRPFEGDRRVPQPRPQLRPRVRAAGRARLHSRHVHEVRDRRRREHQVSPPSSRTSRTA